MKPIRGGNAKKKKITSNRENNKTCKKNPRERRGPLEQRRPVQGWQSRKSKQNTRAFSKEEAYLERGGRGSYVSEKRKKGRRKEKERKGKVSWNLGEGSAGWGEGKGAPPFLFRFPIETGTRLCRLRLGIPFIFFI